jgi:hypothetical protein
MANAPLDSILRHIHKAVSSAETGRQNDQELKSCHRWNGVEIRPVVWHFLPMGKP